MIVQNVEAAFCRDLLTSLRDERHLVRPDTLGQALRIPGVTPAAVAVLASYVGRFTPHPNML